MTEPSRNLALSRLVDTIHRLGRDGHDTPCLDVRRAHWWLSDDRETQQAAMFACKTCKALDACAAYIEQNPEPVGVWAGRKPRPTRLKDDERCPCCDNCDHPTEKGG